VVFTANEALLASSVSEDDFTGTATVTDVTVSENGLDEHGYHRGADRR
jgi:hypothetical protein